ncbi:AAA domain-containing protein [Methylobacterium sp. GC_Met_3]|uniref:AAA domain-containing protein n=1 Tax=Methylobacterium sp. GC_Met_3 TaxID=2937375 RepID=UPI00226A62CA
MSGECRRRLRLDLYANDAARAHDNAPVKDVKRPGLAMLVKQGGRFERRVFADLVDAFGPRVVRGVDLPVTQQDERAFGKIALEDHLDGIRGHAFVIEAEYRPTPSFRRAHRLDDLVDGGAFPRHPSAAARPGLTLGVVRPDILEVIPPDATAPRRRDTIQVDGSILGIPETDTRIGLRIVDVKLSGEPSPSHFAELAYYGMILAGWLEDTRRTDRYVVLKDAAIWPGNHEASAIRSLDTQDRRSGARERDFDAYVAAFGKDLEILPAEVVLGRVRRFLAVDLRDALLTGDWTTLPWHVDSGCIGCDYLGYDWKRNSEPEPELDVEDGTAATPGAPSLCWHEALASEHLSRITGLTRGACGKLRERLVGNVSQLAALEPNDGAFDQHQKLRAGRTLFRARSEVLATGGEPRFPDRSGTSAVLPRFSHVRVALTCDFDVGSGLTFAIGYRLVYLIPNLRKGGAPGRGRFGYGVEREQHNVMLVEKQSPDEERDVVMDLMGRLVGDLTRVAADIQAAYRRHGIGDEQDTKATVQIYLWDKLTFDHICRITGRHLLALVAPTAGGVHARTAPFAWLFPAEQVIEDAKFTSVRSPISIVSDAIGTLLALDVPHYYSLLGVANAYHSEGLAAFRREKELDGIPFKLHPMLHDPLSDQMPSERGHEVWLKKSPITRVNFQTFRDRYIRRAVETRLDAILAVAERITTDLADMLSADAPEVDKVFAQTDAMGAMPRDCEIILQHARLMLAADRLRVDMLMAIPPHQREARFESARMSGFLKDDARTDALARIDRPGLAADPDVLVFELANRSRMTKIKEGDFTWSIMPESHLGRQFVKVAKLKQDHVELERLCPFEKRDYVLTLRDACKVDILAFDRARRVVAVKPQGPLLPAMIATGIIDFDGIGPVPGDGSTPDAHAYAILDPMVIDFFVKPRLEPVLVTMKVPPISQARPLFQDEVLTRLRFRTRLIVRSDVPMAGFLWNADVMATTASDWSPEAGLALLDRQKVGLSPRQRDAVERSVTRRLCLLWGPPGTGKTYTAIAILRTLFADAIAKRKRLRLAITGPTWVAIDTVAKGIPALLRGFAPEDRPYLARLASRQPGPDGIAPELEPFLVRTDDMLAMNTLRDRLTTDPGITIVAATAHQLGRLGPTPKRPMEGYIDFMLVDEASQMPVSQAIVAFAMLDEGASVTVVGDDLQMPPIHPIEPPAGKDHLVGSIYGFYRHYRRDERGPEPEVPPAIDRIMLDRSRRSNAEIVDFVRLAGYGPDLVAVDPALRIHLDTPVPARRPADWPAALPWHAHLATILDPAEPLVAVIHPDEFSSQRNDDEADLVAGLVRSLVGRLAEPIMELTYPTRDLFKLGVGIVTPHRAQQAAIVDRLSTFVTGDRERAAMLSSVDTVERFQGQERDVMIASFGLGDRDQIGSEEEFLYSLNRFNVIASRAKAKLVVIMSRRLVDHLPRDPQILRASRLLKHFADGYLPRVVPASIPGLGACEIKLR